MDESVPLDFVAQACMDLTEALAACTEQEHEGIIMNHIKKVWNNTHPIEDIKSDLQWVNVSEPISLSQHCADKIVVLDFWTYCCINCYHVLPDLAHLEKKYENDGGLVVIGVHCAKFTNEKDSFKVLAAVQRNNIQHPVVNDPKSIAWNALGIQCWPTLLILGPSNKPIFVLTGEGHRDILVSYVGAALKYFGSQINNTPLPKSPNNHIKANPDGILRFPSKVALNPFYRGRSKEPFLAISDTGHHRILLTDFTGEILRIIGGPNPGYNNAKFDEALFDSPQGLCWMSMQIIAVCDTNNHAVRTLQLDVGVVETLAGTGSQSAFGDMGGNCLIQQSLSSPWDLVLLRTPDMDLSVRAPPPPPPPSAGVPAPPPAPPAEDPKEETKKDPLRRVLLVACAGSHQIWAIFLNTTIWWKYKTYQEGTCVCIAGSGAEAARNSTYPLTAAFAQPSGLALRTVPTQELLIADSESSSIRKLSIATGQVTTLCGGDKNPLNLFAFGDVDELGLNAKFQHPLGLAYCDSSKSLYVADTYNHKIKKVDIGTQKVTSLAPTIIESSDPVAFDEPSGLSISSDRKYLYVADTNNHSIKVINLMKNNCQELKVRMPEMKFIEPENLIVYKNDVFLNKKFGTLIIYFHIALETEKKSVNFTAGAPQNWKVSIRDDEDKDVTSEHFEFVDGSHSGTKLPGRVEMNLKHKTDKTHYRLYMGFQTTLCDGGVCFAHSFTVRSTILVRESVKMVESYKITCKVNPMNRLNQMNRSTVGPKHSTMSVPNQ